MRVLLRAQAFDPWQEITAHLAAYPAFAGKYGATAIFIGTLRDFNQGQQVEEMALEHYPGMTEKYLERTVAEAQAKWDILDALVIHRFGQLKLNEPIVLVAVWSSHRQPAFDACRYIIDILKTHAPFWKQERSHEGSRWVSPQD
ncbi:MAG TPA: molybdenum cofactor biosynthesis protein MoaE [Acidiferrobacterales bacterium]|nr:molybdenum cofactor biosynthesis protein MoaE [Acidiferrobacterales bacterium]